ncbi:MAG: hypothetical protein IJ111_01345 [Eggerthellaceae bacterium]|nr:hypothetical protein [Eggerthellaceae bacterium]
MDSIREYEQAMTEFRFKMHQLGIAGIKEAIMRTWDEPEGCVVREIGFDIIEELRGEEYADALYEELWEEMRWRKARVA